MWMKVRNHARSETQSAGVHPDHTDCSTSRCRPDSVADEMSELLSGNSICSNASHILDLCYLTEYQPTVTASDDPEEGEVFGLLDFNLTINEKE